MIPGDPKDVVRRQFELLGAGDAAGATSLWAPEAMNHGRKVNSLGILKVYESLRSLHETHVLHEMIAEGEWVAVRTTCSGMDTAEPEIPVNSGVFNAIPPNGRSYSVQHIHLFRVVDGKLREHWAARDDLGAARQIGLELKPSTERE